MFQITEGTKEKYEKDLKDLKKKLIDVKRSNDGRIIDDSSWEIILSIETRIAEIEEKIMNSHIIIAENTTSIALGDIITVSVLYPNSNEVEFMTFKLSDVISFDEEIDSIPFNSALGQSILGKNVGDKAEFALPNGGIAKCVIEEHIKVKTKTKKK